MSFGSSSTWLCQPCVPVREEDGAGVPWEGWVALFWHGHPVRCPLGSTARQGRSRAVP